MKISINNVNNHPGKGSQVCSKGRDKGLCIVHPLVGEVVQLWRNPAAIFVIPSYNHSSVRCASSFAVLLAFDFSFFPLFSGAWGEGYPTLLQPKRRV
ncbi:hypothetical protein M569_17336 [Genlisea aurea]|uniref:Uncharacterized protein n=1 Tax=Genlisea aurea TaxID=192259 RepID=S8BZ93_9LAMI|nr:hypothetical protein M569_17336 [Genlisea aurea]